MCSANVPSAKIAITISKTALRQLLPPVLPNKKGSLKHSRAFQSLLCFVFAGAGRLAYWQCSLVYTFYYFVLENFWRNRWCPKILTQNFKRGKFLYTKIFQTMAFFICMSSLEYGLTQNVTRERNQIEVHVHVDVVKVPPMAWERLVIFLDCV